MAKQSQAQIDALPCFLNLRMEDWFTAIHGTLLNTAEKLEVCCISNHIRSTQIEHLDGGHEHSKRGSHNPLAHPKSAIFALLGWSPEEGQANDKRERTTLTHFFFGVERAALKLSPKSRQETEGSPALQGDHRRD